MKRYFFPLIAVLFSIFMSSCGDNPILDLDGVEKSDLTTPLFLAYDNTLDKSDKKVWAFNETQAAKAEITVMNNGNLRIKTDWYFDSWSYSGKILSLVSETNKKTYELNQVSVLGYNAISFGTTYVCTPSTNKGINGVRYDDDWYNRGLTKAAFWDALRKSYTQNMTVDIQLN